MLFLFLNKNKATLLKAAVLFVLFSLFGKLVTNTLAKGLAWLLNLSKFFQFGIISTLLGLSGYLLYMQKKRTLNSKAQSKSMN